MDEKPQDSHLADLIARCPEHGYSTEPFPECRCAAARKAAAYLAEDTDPAEDEQREQDEKQISLAHAAGEHAMCSIECEVTFPSEQMRNFVVAKGYPGTAGMLAELERRAAQQAPVVEPPTSDTLPAWLYQRFARDLNFEWDDLHGDTRSYWEHEAAAVRRAVARGGFKAAS